MAYSESLALRVRDLIGRRRGISEKKMFGGIGFLLHGNMLVGVWKDSLIVRLGTKQSEQALRQPHIVEFDITGKSMQGWIMVEPDGIDTADQLNGWIEQATAFVGTLPSK
jgi:TfoX/Sxy family transcriptional regulator of competence genes